MSLIKIYAVCKFSYFRLWYLELNLRSRGLPAFKYQLLFIFQVAYESNELLIFPYNYGRASEMKLSPSTHLLGLCGRCGLRFVGVSLFMAYKEKLLILAGICILKLPPS